MTHTARLAREDTITDALRAADTAIGDEEPDDQALRILAALKALRADQPARVTGTNRVDYLTRVQKAAQAAWYNRHGQDQNRAGIEFEASASVATPLGDLRAIIWRREWRGVRGRRLAWASEYWLGDDPITIDEIRAAGLALRPTSRNRGIKNDAALPVQ